MSLISIPLFRSNNTEKLEVADAYDITNTKTINKVYDAAKGTANKVIDRAGGIRGIASGMQNLVSAKMSGATGRQMLEAGLGMFNTSTIGILRDSTNGIMDKAGEFLDLDPAMVDRVKSGTNDVANRIQYGGFDDMSSYGALTTLMGDLTGQPQMAEYVNMGLEAAVWGSAISQTIDYGQYHYMDDVKQYIDPEVYRQALIYSVPMVASSGSLEAVITLMGQLTVDEIMANKPDFVQAFLTRFKLPDPPPTDNIVYGVQLVSTLLQLNPRWYLYSRNGEDIVDFTALSVASNDARYILEMHAFLGPYMQIAPLFPEATAEEVMREQFPLMVSTLT